MEAVERPAWDLEHVTGIERNLATAPAFGPGLGRPQKHVADDHVEPVAMVPCDELGASGPRRAFGVDDLQWEIGASGLSDGKRPVDARRKHGARNLEWTSGPRHIGRATVSALGLQVTKWCDRR